MTSESILDKPTNEYNLRHAANGLMHIAQGMGLTAEQERVINFAYQQLLRGANTLHGELPTTPDRPGTVGLATINGRRVRVFLVQDGEGLPVWVAASPTTANPIAGVYCAGREALEDFKLLDVVDPETGKLA